MHIGQPDSPALPPSLEPAVARSPLAPRSLLELYLRPRTFFADTARLARQVEYWLIVYLIGVFGVMDKVDQQLLKADLGSKVNDAFLMRVLSSWGSYWALVLGSGLIAAGLVWLFGGWFYRLRLGWSGVSRPDPALARQVWAFQSAVHVLPAMAVALWQTAVHANYLEAWTDGAAWTSVLLLVSIFWGCWVSYAGATTAFPLKRGKARFWFLIVPVVFYAIVFFGLTAALVSHTDGTA